MTFGMYERLGVHVFASNREVIRATRKKFEKKSRIDPRYRTLRKQYYCAMIDFHSRARRLVTTMRL